MTDTRITKLFPTKPDAERAAEFRRRLNEALHNHVDPIIRELEDEGFVAHFAPASENEPSQCIHLAKLFA